MAASDPQLLVSTKWLAEHLEAPDVRVLDCTYFLPGDPRDARAAWAEGHVPGAGFLDIDDVSDARADLPHMLPPAEKFVSRMRRLGVGDGHRVIVYDQDGLFSAARGWWMLRVFGHRDVAVLDGGLPKWIAEGRPMEDVPPVPRERHFTARRDAGLVRGLTQMAAASKLGHEQIVDARAPERFRGEAPEPREGLRAGRIPGSLNVHYRTLLNADGTMKDEAGLRAAFAEAGVDLDRPVASTCGSGVTACILDLALERLGHRRHAVYDGSWSEWGRHPELGIETG